MEEAHWRLSKNMKQSGISQHMQTCLQEYNRTEI